MNAATEIKTIRRNTHANGSAVAVQGPDGHSYLALGPEPGQRGWFKTFAEADEVAPTVVQRCMRRGPRYGSEWTVKTPAP